jgi:peptidoglycan/LPS O-acetylase OafA/YrhL
MFPWAHWRSYLAGLIYMHGFIFHRMNEVNTPFWSLEVEVLFYLTAPLLALVFRIRPAWIRRAILVAAIATLSYSVQHWLTAKHSYLEYTYPGCLHFFLAGMLLADLYVSGIIVRRRSYVWDLVAVGCAASILAVTLPPYWRFHWLTPLPILLGYWGVLQGRIVNACACLRPVTIVGTMCYTIYLWHIVFIFWISSTFLPYLISARLTDDQALLLSYLVGVPPILLASAVMFYFTEKPFMNGPGSRYLEKMPRRVGKPRAAIVHEQLEGSSV